MDDRTTGDSPHEILLALAGRVDDDLLAWCRELVAVGEDGRALELIIGTLVADGTALAPHDRAAVVAAARAARTDLDPDTVLPPASADAAIPHHFDAGPGVEHLAAAVGALPERLVAGCRTWVTFRTTPAGSAPGPLPQPVVLVEVPAGDGRPVDVLGYQLSIACVRVGAPAAVEVVVAGTARPDYQRAALAAAVAVHGADEAADMLDTDAIPVQHPVPGPAETETPPTGILESAPDDPTPQRRRYRREDAPGPESSWDFGLLAGRAPSGEVPPADDPAPDADPPLFGGPGFARSDVARSDAPGLDAGAVAGVGSVEGPGSSESSGGETAVGSGADGPGPAGEPVPGESDPVAESPLPTSYDPEHAGSSVPAGPGASDTDPFGTPQADPAGPSDTAPQPAAPAATPDGSADDPSPEPAPAVPADPDPDAAIQDATIPDAATILDAAVPDAATPDAATGPPDRLAPADAAPAPVTPLWARTDPPRPRPTAARPVPSPIPLGRRRPLAPVSDLPRDPVRPVPPGSDGPALASIGDPFGAPPGDGEPYALPAIDEADPLGLGRLPMHDPDDRGGDHRSDERPDTPAADDWLADWISGDWAMSRSTSHPDPLDPRRPVPGPSAVADPDARSARPRGEAETPQDGPPPAPRPTPLPQRPSPTPHAAPPPVPVPDEPARLSEADRDLLARLQAELGVGDAPKPRVSRRAGIAGEPGNGRAPHPPDRAG